MLELSFSFTIIVISVVVSI